MGANSTLCKIMKHCVHVVGAGGYLRRGGILHTTIRRGRPSVISAVKTGRTLYLDMTFKERAELATFGVIWSTSMRFSVQGG